MPRKSLMLIVFFELLNNLFSHFLFTRNLMALFKSDRNSTCDSYSHRLLLEVAGVEKGNKNVPVVTVLRKICKRTA